MLTLDHPAVAGNRFAVVPEAVKMRLRAGLDFKGYAMAQGADVSVFSRIPGDAWSAFAESWHALPRDEYMADGGTYRFRRYSAFRFSADTQALDLLPPAPFHQSLEVNSLNGGMQRRFAPLEPQVIAMQPFQALTLWLANLFAEQSGRRHWKVEAHPIRVVTGMGQAGQPTPEGLHRDGVDFIAVLMINRINVGGGITTVTDASRNVLANHILTRPGDLVLLDDRRTMHKVSAITPIHANARAYRDVLILGFTGLQETC